jgi:phytoene dehydrogenase-like protein
MVDVATPLTFERYTANWQGSYEGWLLTTKSIRMRMRKTLPAVANFHMIGQWVQPGGGLPPGAVHGRDVIKKICRQNRLKFQTTEA